MTAKPTFTLRPDQERTLQAVQQALRDHDSVLATAPTGAGKTVMFSEIIRRSGLKGIRSDIVVHREELIEQAVSKIRQQTGIAPGVVWQRRREWDQPIRVISHGALAALKRMPAGVRQAPLLFLDEAHHGPAPGWRHAIALLSPRWLIGFTATPFRHDREPLTPDPFGAVIRTITPEELIQLGVLVPPVVESPAVSDRHGAAQPISQAENLPAIYTNAVRYALGQGRSKIILFNSSAGRQSPTQIGEATQRKLEQAGIPAGLISQRLSSKERRRLTASFEAMPAAALISYMTLTEGFDSTAVDCVILGRQTRSESTLIQMIGRGLRSHPGKESCLVLDFTGRNDVYNVINYWRLDDTSPDQTATERVPRGASESELDTLTATFPRIVSAMAATRAQYPWFQPFPKRRLRALCLWDPDHPEPGSTYVCVEPSSRQRWTVAKVKIPDRRLTGQVKRLAQTGLDSRQAAQAVVNLIGQRSALIARSASWRRQPASDKQRRLWQRLNRTAPPQHLSRGSASDAISRDRFIHRVKPGLV